MRSVVSLCIHALYLSDYSKIIFLIFSCAYFSLCHNADPIDRRMGADVSWWLQTPLISVLSSVGEIFICIHRSVRFLECYLNVDNYSNCWLIYIQIVYCFISLVIWTDGKVQ